MTSITELRASPGSVAPFVFTAHPQGVQFKNKTNPVGASLKQKKTRG